MIRKAVFILLLCVPLLFSCNGGGSVLVLLPGEDYDILQYRIAMAALPKEGFNPVVISADKEYSAENKSTAAVEEYTSLFLIEGEGEVSQSALDYIHKTCKEFKEEEKPIAAIGEAPAYLASAGLVEGINVACWPSKDKIVAQAGGIPRHTITEYSSGILTGIGGSDMNILDFISNYILVMKGRDIEQGSDIPALTFPFTLDEKTGRYYMSHKGHFRTGQVVVPDTYDASKKYSLVFGLHGTAGTGDDFRRMGFDQMAEEYDFIMVYPDGYNGDWDIVPEWETPVDDLGMFKKLIAEMKKEYPIEEERIYVTGHSLGSFMAYRLGYDLSGIITAVAPVSGLLYKPWEYDDKVLGVSMLHIHAIDDWSVPFEHEGIYPNPVGVMDSVEFWKDLTGVHPDGRVFFNKSGITGTLWSNESSGIDVGLVTYPTGAHGWPYYATQHVTSFFYNHPPRGNKAVFDTDDIPSYIEVNDSLQLKVEASYEESADESIEYVEFLVNGDPVKRSTDRPFSAAFSSAETGDFRITGRARLASGEEIALSNDVKFSVIGTDLAAGAAVTSSSIESEGFEAMGVVDHNSFTRWASKASDPQWISVDLGEEKEVGGLTILWETAYASEYEIQTSANGTD